MASNRTTRYERAYSYIKNLYYEAQTIYFMNREEIEKKKKHLFDSADWHKLTRRDRDYLTGFAHGLDNCLLERLTFRHLKDGEFINSRDINYSKPLEGYQCGLFYPVKGFHPFSPIRDLKPNSETV